MNNRDENDILDFFSRAFDPMLKKQQLEEASRSIKDLFDALVAAGFTEDQAIKLLGTITGASL